MKIAVAGKGGAGKTTLAATLARTLGRRGMRVLAIDGDPNPNLGLALGLPPEAMEALTPLPRTVLEQRTDDTGATRHVLARPIEDITATYGVAAPDAVTLLLTGRVDHAGKG